MRRMLMLLLVAIVAGSLGAVGAYFTGQAQVPENLIRAGSVALSTEPTSAALSVDALPPGGTAIKPLTVVNDGSLPINVIVTGAKKAGITEFYEALTARVTCEGTLLFDGPLSQLRTTPLPLAPGARSQLQFALGLPETAGNELAGDYAKLTLYVDAEQTH